MAKSKDDLFPPLGIALYYLRTNAKVSREEFGRPLGLSSKTISEFESGHRTLTRARAEQLIEPHGFGPQALDEVLSDIAARRGILSPEGTIPLPPEELRRLAREQREISGFLASELARLRRLERARVDHAKAGELFEHLASRTPEERRWFVSRAEKYRLWALSVRFGEESAKAASDSAARAVEYAMHSLRIARLAPASPKFRSLLSGQAWAFLANARRVSGYLPKADKGFTRSSRLWQEGEGGDPDRLLDHTRRLDLEASLRLQQDRLDEALTLLDQALAAGAVGVVAGRRLLQKAFALERCGQPEAALRALDDAAHCCDVGLDPQLELWLVGNRAVSLCHLDRYAEAANLVPFIRARAIELRNGLDLVRVLWLEARTFAGLGRTEEAIASLDQVRRDFAAEGIAYDTALAALELAALHLDQGKPHAARELAEDVAKLLDVQRVPRDLLAALSLFVKALEQEQATAAAARDLLRVFERRRPIESTSWTEEQ
ncbi:MAG TPA: helix-turn-helix transcriptional regulator [Thermoanaerobaculia bacterium]|jgi:tetratricopeptide (TPR) repeat protein|nr:helix-turn-helix transcriptional regulator [Thermoanaerobaculia bacterium]